MLLDRRRAPATINRILSSLTRFFDDVGRRDDNPARPIDRVDVADRAPQALSRTAWNAVRRAAEQHLRRDHGLALALVGIMRYAGLRVSEVAALQIPDVTLTPRRGLVVVRRAKGLKHREIPLILEARELLAPYLDHRRQLADRWMARAELRRTARPAWAAWPGGHLFLGQRGPLHERGIHAIVAQLGQRAKLATPLHPQALRHTFATALLDPGAYGLDRPPLSLIAVQTLLGHADPATTAVYTRTSPADLARMMGEPSDVWID